MTNLCCRVLSALVLFLAPFVIWPNYRRATERPSSRACCANQRCVAGAIEMYDLDHKTTTTDIDGVLFRALQAEGYLQTVPDDPCFGKGSNSHYRLWKGGVFCTHHGFIRPPDGTHFNTPARLQLRAAGCTDEALLAACSMDVPFPKSLPRYDLAALLVMACWLGAASLLRSSRRRHEKRPPCGGL